MVTNSGGGYSRWRDFDITRWRADTTRDHWGSFLYFRDIDDGGSWSLGFHPLDRPERRYSVTYSAEKVEFRRRDYDMETEGQVVVSPEDDAEIRLISLTNRSLHARTIELTSYTELALAPHASDRAHPAFGNLFVQTRAIPERRALLAWRRQRSPEEPTIWVGQVLLGVSPPGKFTFETDRLRFVGRGRTLRNPSGLVDQLENTEGYVLDPVFCLRSQVTLGPRQQVRAALVTIAAASEDEAIALIRKYSEMPSRESNPGVGVGTHPTSIPLPRRGDGPGATVPGTGRPHALPERGSAPFSGATAQEYPGPIRVVGPRDLRRPADSPADRRG